MDRDARRRQPSPQRDLPQRGRAGLPHHLHRDADARGAVARARVGVPRRTKRVRRTRDPPQLERLQRAHVHSHSLGRRAAHRGRRTRARAARDARRGDAAQGRQRVPRGRPGRAVQLREADDGAHDGHGGHGPGRSAAAEHLRARGARARARARPAARRESVPARTDRLHRHPSRRARDGRRGPVPRARRGHGQRALGRAAVSRPPGLQPGRPRRALGRGELARRAVRGDAPARGVRHEWPAHHGAAVRRLDLSRRSVR